MAICLAIPTDSYCTLLHGHFSFLKAINWDVGPHLFDYFMSPISNLNRQAKRPCLMRFCLPSFTNKVIIFDMFEINVAEPAEWKEWDKEEKQN